MEKQFIKVKDVKDNIDIKEVMQTRYRIKDGIYARIKNGVIVIVGDGKNLAHYIMEQIIQIFKEKMLSQKKKQPFKVNVFYFKAVA